MTSTQLDVYISSGAHITRPAKRIAKIEKAVDHIDTVFVESPCSDPPRARTQFFNFVAVPFVLIGLWLWVGLAKLLRTLTGNGDEQIVSHFEENHGAEVIKTDRNVHSLLTEGRLVWAVGHYALVLVALLGLPLFVLTQFQFLSPLLRVLVFGITIAAALFANFIAGTMAARNARMAEDIEAHAEQTDATAACLVTGAAHEPGVRRRLEESNRVTVHPFTDE